MNNESDIIAARRESVIQAYNSAKAENHLRYLEGDVKATEEYIFENQKWDANRIVQAFFDDECRVVSVSKKTKVGMDGLMIQLAILMTTHPNDSFVVNPANVRIITGMSNAGWEKDMKEKSPNCFKSKIFHHGQLQKANLNQITNGLIIIDEIDTGDKEYQVLHNVLKNAGVLDVNHMVNNNNRFMFASATMIKELYDLYRWGELHKWVQMTIPPNYIGQNDFLNMGIIKEFYHLNSPENADRWIQEDIIDNYGIEYRVNIVRVNNKSVNAIHNACIRNGLNFYNNTSTDRLSDEDIKMLFVEPLNCHIVIAIKGFLRRANYIPNKWKMRIGATHELYTKVVDNSVQVQGLPGRTTGYWRHLIESGHKTGPYRTSVKAIEEYETTFNDPFGRNSYQTAGFKKKNGRIKSDPTMLSVRNIVGIIPLDLPDNNNNNNNNNNGEFERGYREFDNQTDNETYATMYGAQRATNYETNELGFKICSTTTLGVHSLDEILKFTTTANVGSNLNKRLADLNVGECAHRRYVCYKDINDKNTECFVTIWVKRLREAI